MTRKDAIVARRSVRTYTAEPIKDSVLAELRKFIGQIKPLHSSIKTNVTIHSREDFNRKYRSTFAHNAQHFIVIRSVMKDGYLENAGFIGQQIVLFLTEMDVGTCWLGMCKPKAADDAGQLPYVVTICFGRSDNAPRRLSPEEAKRKLVHEIVLGKISSPVLLPLLDAGRLAPSSLNSQPVRYITEGSNIYVYRKRPPVVIKFTEDMNRIDVGVALANIYVASGETRVFVREKNYPTPQPNCEYEYTALDSAELAELQQ